MWAKARGCGSVGLSGGALECQGSGATSATAGAGSFCSVTGAKPTATGLQAALSEGGIDMSGCPTSIGWSGQHGISGIAELSGQTHAATGPE